MPVSAQRQHHTQSHHSVSSARPDHANTQPAPVWAPALTRQQAWGNQALQRLLRTRAIQAKLTVNQPSDPYEQEADRVAEQVMRMPDNPADPAEATPDAKPLVQRRVTGVSQTGTATAPPIVHEVLASSGRPLDTATRAFFEPRFGHDFGNVRVHTDEKAAASARSVDAEAYTVGNNIVFGEGRYAPTGIAGRELIAHEMTHAVQQMPDRAIQATQSGVESTSNITLSSPTFLARRPAEETGRPTNLDFQDEIQEAIATFESIENVAPGQYVLEYKGERHELVETQFRDLDGELRGRLTGAINRLRDRTYDAQSYYSLVSRMFLWSIVANCL